MEKSTNKKRKERNIGKKEIVHCIPSRTFSYSLPLPLEMARAWTCYEWKTKNLGKSGRGKERKSGANENEYMDKKDDGKKVERTQYARNWEKSTVGFYIGREGCWIAYFANGGANEIAARTNERMAHDWRCGKTKIWIKNAECNQHLMKGMDDRHTHTHTEGKREGGSMVVWWWWRCHYEINVIVRSFERFAVRSLFISFPFFLFFSFHWLTHSLHISSERVRIQSVSESLRYSVKIFKDDENDIIDSSRVFSIFLCTGKKNRHFANASTTSKNRIEWFLIFRLLISVSITYKRRF